MTVMITGGNGFIGSKLVDAIEDSFSFDLAEEKDGNVNGHIESAYAVSQAALKADGILHLAAVSRVNDCEKNPHNCVLVNILGTLNVIEAAVSNGLKWVALVSTGEVEWIRNDSIKSFKKIDNVYGVTKLSGELFLEVFNNKHEISMAVFRISSVVFGGLDDNQNKVLPVFVRHALLGEEIVINNTEIAWDFIHVDQVVEKITTAIPDVTGQEPGGGVMEIDISSGVKLDLLSLASIVHYLSKSTSIIRLGTEEISIIQKDKFEEILIENEVSTEFVDFINQTIHMYKAVYN